MNTNNADQEKTAEQKKLTPTLSAMLYERTPLGNNTTPLSVNIDDIDKIKAFTDSKEIELASGDLADRIRDDEHSRTIRSTTYYRDIIFALVQIRLPEAEARRDWTEILKHKYTISEKLGRNIGIHVATLDYYINIKRRMLNPKIIDATEYADTASRAITDELTRAYNRHFFFGELRRLFSLARMFNTTFSLLMIDLDHFKLYNDINGHIKGDIALMQTVNIFHAVCNTRVTVCRYGGEEFAILLPEYDTVEAQQIAENIRSAVYDFRFINEYQLPNKRLSISCGISSYREEMKNFGQIIEEADRALYRAKNSGRNRIELYSREIDGTPDN